MVAGSSGRGVGITSISSAVNGSMRRTSASGRVVPLRSAVEWNAGDVLHNGITNVSVIKHLYLSTFLWTYQLLRDFALPSLLIKRSHSHMQLLCMSVNILDISWTSDVLCRLPLKQQDVVLN
jgi:hypothetical protein